MTNEARLEQVKSEIKALEENKKQIEAEIEKAKKPKLRHGDCLITSEGNMYMTNDRHPCNPEEKRPFGISTYGGQVNVDECDPIVYFNVFDDLEALKKDVKYYKTRNTDHGDDRSLEIVGGTSTVTLHFREDSGGTSIITIPKRNLSELVMKLRQMEATIKRR
jgi:hypothetical protein